MLPSPIHKRRLIITILAPIPALDRLRTLDRAIQTTPPRLLLNNPWHIQLRRIIARNLDFGAPPNERIRLASNSNLLCGFDLVADGREGDGACFAFGVGGEGDDAGEFVGGGALGVGFGGARGGDIARGLEFFGDGGLAVAAGGGDGDAFDQVGHGHLNVELDEVGEGVELDVAE
jgi:hypothetical protein